MTLGLRFPGHDSVQHNLGQYVKKDGITHTNTVEGSFAILERGVYGNVNSVSESNLHGYLAEFDFRCKSRAALGVVDAERTTKEIEGVVGKRLTYRQLDRAAHA